MRGSWSRPETSALSSTSTAPQQRTSLPPQVGFYWVFVRALEPGGQSAGQSDGATFWAPPRRPEPSPPLAPCDRRGIQALTRSRSAFPTLKNGTLLAGTLTIVPVFGFRPLRALRRRILKLPKPRSSTFSPFASASVMLSKTVSTIASLCFFVRCATFDGSSIGRDARSRGDSLGEARSPLPTWRRGTLGDCEEHGSPDAQQSYSSPHGSWTDSFLERLGLLRPVQEFVTFSTRESVHPILTPSRLRRNTNSVST